MLFDAAFPRSEVLKTGTDSECKNRRAVVVGASVISSSESRSEVFAMDVLARVAPLATLTRPRFGAEDDAAPAGDKSQLKTVLSFRPILKQGRIFF